jgi:hypothetical protein
MENFTAGELRHQPGRAIWPHRLPAGRAQVPDLQFHMRPGGSMARQLRSSDPVALRRTQVMLKAILAGNLALASILGYGLYSVNGTQKTLDERIAALESTTQKAQVT